MMTEGKILKQRTMHKFGGYTIKDIEYDNSLWGGEGTSILKMAFNEDDVCVGDPKFAHFLYVENGIKPEPIDDSRDICSIGYCEKEDAWYGWSHRAIYGFTIGTKVKMGDCAFAPSNMDEFIRDQLIFWTDEYHEETKAAPQVTIEEDGTKVHGVIVSWKYNDKVPAEELRGKEGSVFVQAPETWGRGEWVAETMDDARQMACDFARGVA